MGSDIGHGTETINTNTNRNQGNWMILRHALKERGRGTGLEDDQTRLSCDLRAYKCTHNRHEILIWSLTHSDLKHFYKLNTNKH